MKRVWMSRNFSFIFEASPTTNLGCFMQSLYAHSIGMFYMLKDNLVISRLSMHNIGLYKMQRNSCWNTESICSLYLESHISPSFILIHLDLFWLCSLFVVKKIGCSVFIIGLRSLHKGESSKNYVKLGGMSNYSDISFLI